MVHQCYGARRGFKFGNNSFFGWFYLLFEIFLKNEVTDKAFDKSKISNMTTDYKLRTYTSGCYYLDEKYEEWTGLNLNAQNLRHFNNNIIHVQGGECLF